MFPIYVNRNVNEQYRVQKRDKCLQFQKKRLKLAQQNNLPGLILAWMKNYWSDFLLTTLLLDYHLNFKRMLMSGKCTFNTMHRAEHPVSWEGCHLLLKQVTMYKFYFSKSWSPWNTGKNWDTDPVTKILILKYSWWKEVQIAPFQTTAQLGSHIFSKWSFPLYCPTKDNHCDDFDKYYCKNISMNIKLYEKQRKISCQ